MKNNLYSCTAITPPQIVRDPVTAFIASSLSVASGTLAYSMISIGVSLAVSAVASWASMALAGTPETERGLITNIREATAAREYVYGTVRKGGVITYMESTGGTKNEVLHQILCLAGHEIDAVSDIYINDEIVTLSGADYNDGGEGPAGGGWVLSDAWTDGDGTPKIRILVHRGDQTATTDGFANDASATLANTLIAESGTGLDSNFVGKGLAYLYIRLDYDPDVFASGIPLFTALVRGKRVYNHGNGQVEFSNNFADVVRDYLTGDHGLAEPVANIDTVDFSVAHNISAEDVPLAAGGTQNRYEINGVFAADRAPSSVLGDMMTAGAASLFWGQGQWKLRPGYYSAPVKSLSEVDLRSGMSVDPRVPMRDNFNVVRGTFADWAQDFIQADYPEVGSAVFLAADGGVENALDMPLPFTTDASMAQRLAKLTLFRAREQAAFSAEFSMMAFDLEPGDIIALTIYKYGWFGKEFEVTDWRLVPGADGQPMAVGLKLRETSAAAYAWDGDERDILGNNTSLPDPRLNLSVANLAAVPFTRQAAAGTTLVGAGLSWDASDNAFITGYDVEWRLTSEATHQTALASDTSYEITGLVDGAEYSVRVRSVSSDGRRGNWALLTFTGGGDDTIPNAPSGLGALGGFQTVSLNWFAPSANTDASPLVDLAHFNIYRGTSSNVAGAVYVGAAAGQSYLDGGLADNTTYHYWVAAVDRSGNEGAKSARAVATTNFISATQMVSDIRAQIGAQNAIPGLSSLPSPAGYAVNDYVVVDKKLYRKDGNGTWQPMVGDIEANSITGAMIQGNTISGTNVVGDNLAAIFANLGEVTAGSINTLSSGTGVQINVAGKRNATYIYQNAEYTYGLYCKNSWNAVVVGRGGAAKFESRDGYTVQIVQSDAAHGNCALDGQNSAGGGGQGQIGLSSFNGGYAFNSVSGGYYDGSGDGYNPFTGCHEALALKGHAIAPGDIVCDGAVIAKKLSDAVTVISSSSSANQRTALGVFNKSSEFEYAPAAMMDNSTQPELVAIWSTYEIAKVNSVGEGSINVCGQGGDIAPGDLIVTSDTAGKGMRQADDLVRSSTVARAREGVTFATPGEVKQIACIYLCG